MSVPAISSVVLRDTISLYAQNYTVHSSTVAPLPGQQFINPQERCSLHLTATNDPSFGGAGQVGVRLVNVRWHVWTTNATLNIVVPDAPLDSRAGPTQDLPLLTPGDDVSELYVFPRFAKKVLEPGETDDMTLECTALAVGTILVMFDLVCDVDPDALELVDQTCFPLASLGTAQVVT